MSFEFERIDLEDPGVAADVFERAARANRRSRRRRGATVHLPRRGRLLVSGDLHDHDLNFRRLVDLAELPASRYHHILLHEVIHGDEIDDGKDYSVLMLAKTAALKLEFPSQVHLMMGNHELAQLSREAIYKGGVALVDAFAQGLNGIYGRHADRVRRAMHEFMRSLVLAVKCANGIFCSHSLPGQEAMGSFDPGVIDRIPTDQDLAEDGHAYQLVWGRGHDEKLVARLGKAWGARIFVIGHQPAEDGYAVQNERLLVVASDHDAGVALPVRLSRTYEMESLVQEIRPLVTAGVPA